MSKPTPGPWSDEGLSFVPGSTHDLRDWLCYVEASVHGLVAVAHGKDAAEAVDNARLIAAAPELLEALERLKKAADALAAYMPGDDGLDYICEELDRADEQASAALRKAKGEL